jgi:hypothetical protein
MVCALALLAQPGQTIPGWQEGSRRPPGWWSEATSPISLQVSQGQGQLFEEVLSERLFHSDAFRHRDGRPPHLNQALNLLAERGRLSRESLAQSLGLSRTQLASLLPHWTRWLNVAGHAVLRLDLDEVWLDQDAIHRILG